MSKTGCQCIACACSAESTVGAPGEVSAVSHYHVRLPSVLRYRGLENEAAMATRLVKVESLIGTLRSVLDDLDGSMGAWVVSPGLAAAGSPGIAGDDTPDCDPRSFARRHVQLVQRVLETALSRLHSDLAGAGEDSTRPPIA